MPGVFDYLLPNSVEDSLQPKVPRVEYAPAHFLPGGKVNAQQGSKEMPPLFLDSKTHSALGAIW